MSTAATPDLAEKAVKLVEGWLVRARQDESRSDRRTIDRLQGVVADPSGLSFAMRFVDRVIRPEDNSVAAAQLVALVESEGLPEFLSPIDRVLMRAGVKLAPIVPWLVMPLATARMRQLVGHLVVDAEPKAMRSHLEERTKEGFGLNVNLLGEAVLGDAEAGRRLEATAALIDQPDVEYVSVKLSAIVAQLNYWAFDDCVERVCDRLRPLLAKAAESSPPVFVNLDMEEYHDLELTVAVFKRLLDEPELNQLDAGIVLQAYLPDSFGALQDLVDWAGRRHRQAVDGGRGGEIKIRLVKGANLAMERVDAAIHGWEQTPYSTKADTDANYKRCLDWVLTTDRTRAVRIGLASHNLFDVAWGHLLSVERGVAHRLEFEMLQGMAPAEARVVRDDGDGLRLYTPVVARQDFDVAISYLFRRLEENSLDENFIRHLFDLEAGTVSFESEAGKFRASLDARWEVSEIPRRTQDRTNPGCPTNPALPFENEPDTDPALARNRVWANRVLDRSADLPSVPWVTELSVVDRALDLVANGQVSWAGTSLIERRRILHQVADEMSRRRGDLVAAMIGEAGKTLAQADPEVSEAIDFARWYGDRAVELDRSDVASLEPLGVLVVVPPWNFPVAIPTGGILAALAAGNGVVMKPAPETPRCAEIVVECCLSAGVPQDALQFLRTPDDDVGRHLITHKKVAGVILTGAWETAELFRSWKPELRIFAETSGKNALVITANADIDLAVRDLVDSAFGHSGQKCSAASLAICVGSVYTSDRFRRQLADAVRSLRVGPVQDPRTTMGPTIHEPESKLLRALTELEAGEEWLVEPERLDERTWSPGVKLGVTGGSWFHQTECFGPVLGLMFADDIDDALRIQNGSPFGLAGGIHSLDPVEIERWLDAVEVGNAYVNRPTTGAIVQRQPFGGWKRSAIGPGAKAGGPNYVTQLGTWRPTNTFLDDEAWLEEAVRSDRDAWSNEFSVERDSTGLFCESNRLHYRPLRSVAVRVESSGMDRELARVLAAAQRCGVSVELSRCNEESVQDFTARLGSLDVCRVRVLGEIATELRITANEQGIHLADDPVTSEGRIELRHYLREQSISQTLHRHGNLL